MNERISEIQAFINYGSAKAKNIISTHHSLETMLEDMVLAGKRYGSKSNAPAKECLTHDEQMKLYAYLLEHPKHQERLPEIDDELYAVKLNRYIENLLEKEIDNQSYYRSQEDKTSYSDLNEWS